MKRCIACGEFRSVVDFYKTSNGKSRSYCKPCHKAGGVKNRRKAYGITSKQYDEMLQAQRGCCAICGQVMNPPVIDHDHACCPEERKSCGRCIRFLLCSNCNVLLGMAKDDPKVLRKAADYLERT